MMKQNLVRKANQLLGYTMAVPLAAGALFMPCTVSAATNDVAVVAPTNQTVGQKAHVIISSLKPLDNKYNVKYEVKLTVDSANGVPQDVTDAIYDGNMQITANNKTYKFSYAVVKKVERLSDTKAQLTIHWWLDTDLNDLKAIAPKAINISGGTATVNTKSIKYIKRVTNKDEALKQQLIAKTKRIDTKKTPGLKGVEANILIDSMSENKKLFTEKYVLAEKGMNLTVCQEVPDAKIDNVGFIGNTMQMRIKMSQDSCFEALNIKEAKGNDLYALGLEDMGTHYYAYKVKDTATLKKCQVEVTYKKVLAEDTHVEAATWQVKG